MGCGAMCGNPPANTKRHVIYSQAALQQLIPRIKICKPLLQEQTYEKFSRQIKQSNFTYHLKVHEAIAPDQNLAQEILEKWKIVLYGLDKHNEYYEKCVGFELRLKNVAASSANNVDGPWERNILKNESYHQVKVKTQYHDCFGQIEKDLNRTFEFKQEKKNIFQKVLKRIANHFPSMGYTQGVNFVVGYLLVLGYSQSDTFWLFVHLALNKRFLLLGLYEDGFPLSNIYTLIFKNMLKRMEPKLYNHIYNNLMLDDSIWIFKWFITYYIYSFPLECIKYVWDLVVEVGGFGLVYFALALVIELKDKLLKIDDPCDVSQLFQSIKKLDAFNSHIKIDRVLEFAYSIKFCRNDFEGINQYKPSFYKDYFVSQMNDDVIEAKLVKKSDQATNDTGFPELSRRSNLVLIEWYKKIMEERQKFLNNQIKQKKEMELPMFLHTQFQQIEKSIQELQERVILNESAKIERRSSKKIQDPNFAADNYFQEMLQANYEIRHQESRDVEGQGQRNSRKVQIKFSYDIEEQIGELDNEEDSNSHGQIESSLNETKSKINEQNCVSIMEQIDKISANGQSKGKNVFKINTLYPIYDGKRKINLNEQRPKVNNFGLCTQEKRSGLSLAGQNILYGITISNNSHYSSASSKNASLKPKKQKENHISRYSKSGKVKTEEASRQSGDPSSQHESSIDRNTDKQSCSNYSHRQNTKAQKGGLKVQGYCQRSQHEFMTNSHGPEEGSGKGNQLGSQIEIFNGDGLFKKKKKVSHRISNVTSFSNNVSSALKLQVEGEGNRKYLSKMSIQNEREDESVQSQCLPGTSRRHNPAQNQLNEMLYEIESVK